MRLVALESACAAASIALLQDGEIVRHARLTVRYGQGDALLPMLRDAMAEAGWGFGDVDGFAVSVGPGSFTGLRVGLATARGLALAADRPLVGVSTFEAVGETARRAGVSPALVAIDTRRGSFYLQRFTTAGEPDGEPWIGQAADLSGLAAEAPGSIASDLSSLPDGTPLVLAPPDAEAVARLAARRWPVPRDLPRPLYIYPPQVSGGAG